MSFISNPHDRRWSGEISPYSLRRKIYTPRYVKRAAPNLDAVSEHNLAKNFAPKKTRHQAVFLQLSGTPVI
jgi:hypothetical protein